MTATQINIEIGELTTTSPDGQRVALSGDARATWLELARKWADGAHPRRETTDAQSDGAQSEQQGRRHLDLEGNPDYAKPKAS